MRRWNVTNPSISKTTSERTRQVKSFVGDCRLSHLQFFTQSCMQSACLADVIVGAKVMAAVVRIDVVRNERREEVDESSTGPDEASMVVNLFCT